MKKESTNRRKKLPLLLGALLIISVAAYGTRAYFSDSATQQADIQLTLGNLDIESVGSKWKYTPENDNVNSALLANGAAVTNNMEITPLNAKNITNVQPGDQFTRIFTFKNIGSLVQNVTVNNVVTNDVTSIFNATFIRVEDDGTDSSDQGTVALNPTGSVNYKMVISVKTDNDFNRTHNRAGNAVAEDIHILNAISDDDVATSIIENAVTVTAEQKKNNVSE
ncbi:MAG: hypothetical protein PWR19_2071 [Carnobacterium sp.]|uniref:hypothetical protein n=1 Tax=Carnobacterium sp. TaxID=48221 RepID=UPI002649276C|nr:hypothetical protein [Carnobacterium sp.]MDN5373025.1 hypothetical protein [Carnobacterium sp.]